jgi:glyoxylate/hydroxypyruvate reductase A
MSELCHECQLIRQPAPRFEHLPPEAFEISLCNAPREFDYALLWDPPDGFFKKVGVRRAVFSFGAGVELIVRREVPGNLPLIRVEDAGMAASVQDFVLAQVLRVSRGFDVYAERQAAHIWAPEPPRSRESIRIGVLGLGVLGGSVAADLTRRGFGTCGFSLHPREIDGVQCHSGTASSEQARDPLSAFSQFLRNIEVLVCILPATPVTAGVLSKEAFLRMPKGSHLIALGRGSHLVESDLLECLHTGHLKSALLDVFESEPLPSASRLWQHPRISVTPHVAGGLHIRSAAAQIARKLQNLEAHLPVTGIVNLELGY